MPLKIKFQNSLDLEKKTSLAIKGKIVKRKALSKVLKNTGFSNKKFPSSMYVYRSIARR